MAEKAEQIRRVRGGVGTLETKCITEFKLKDLEAGTIDLGVKVPAGCIVIGAALKNGKDDLAGGTSLGLKLGAEDLIEATALGTLKGKAAGGAYTEGFAIEKDEELKLVVAGTFTAGTVDICVLYM